MKSNSIKVGAIISYISILLNIVISLLYTPWMIHEIGISDYGIYSLIVSFLSYFLLDFGLGEAISRFISKFRADNDRDGINRMFSVTTLVYTLMSFGIALILVILYFFLSDIFVKLSLAEIITLRKVYLIAGFFSVCTFGLKPFDGALVAYEHFVPLKVLDMCQRMGTVFLITLALLLGGDIYWLVFINGIVGLIVSLTKGIFLFKKEHLQIRLKWFEKSLAHKLFNFSFWVFLINIAQRLRLNIVPSILGIFCGTTEIAIFSVAMNLEGFIYTFSNALNGLFMPKVSRMVRENDSREELTNLMIKVGRVQLFIVGFIIVGLFGLGHSFIRLWIGNSFYNTYWVMVLLVAVYLVFMTQQIGSTLSYVVNEVRYNSIFAFSTSICSLLLSICLAPKWGAIGCGIAVFVALSLNTIMLNVFYAKKLNLDVIRFFKECHLRIGPFLLVFTMVLYFVDSTSVIKNWVSLFMAGFVYSICFCLVSYFMVMNIEERNMVYNFIAKIKK